MLPIVAREFPTAIRRLAACGRPIAKFAGHRRPTANATVPRRRCLCQSFRPREDAGNPSNFPAIGFLFCRSRLKALPSEACAKRVPALP